MTQLYLRLWIAIKLAAVYCAMLLIMIFLLSSKLLFGKCSKRISEMSTIVMKFPNGREIVDHLKWWNLYEIYIISMPRRFKRIFCNEIMINGTFDDKDNAIYKIEKNNDDNNGNLMYSKDKFCSMINPEQYTILFIGSCT